MPPYHASLHIPKSTVEGGRNHELQHDDVQVTVQASPAELERLADLHRQTTQESHAGLDENDGVHAEFRDYLRENDLGGRWYPKHQGVCFDSLSVFGSSGSRHSAKTLGTALWRTLTFQDILEQIAPSSFKLRKSRPRAIISNFSGVVNSGEMML
jgi:ATP-binding cassette subfamily G (WHITE) protein 2 (SNQ2)